MKIIIKTDLNGRINFVNKGFEKATFFARKNVVNGNFWNLIDLCFDSRTIEEMKKYLFNGKIYRGVIALRANMENGIVYLEYEITPIDREGNVIDGILRNGEVDGFMFYGRKTEDIDKIIKMTNLKECIERRVFYKTA